MRIMYIADILDVNNALCSNVQSTTSLRGYPRKNYVIDHDYGLETHRAGEEKEIRHRILIESPKETLKNYLGSE